MTTGLDLVKLQLHVAAGGRLEGDPPQARGHAIEARVNAEDPERGFAPAPGAVAAPEPPDRAGIRVNTGVSEGDAIPAGVRLDDREGHRLGQRTAPRRWPACAGRSRRCGRRARRGDQPAFLLDLLVRPEVVDGTADTGWLDRLAAEGGLLSDRNAGVAIIAAAIDADAVEETFERGRFYASARRGRPKTSHEIRRTMELAPSRRVVPRDRRAVGAAPLPRDRPRGRRRRPGRALRALRVAALGQRARSTGWSPSPTRRTTSSRSMASPTASRTTRAAWSGRRRPPSWLRSSGGRRVGRRRRPGRRPREHEDGDDRRRAVRRGGDRGPRGRQRPG